MPTYHEILTTDLSTLTTAAERWDGMAKKLHTQETAYRRDVHGITLRPTFVGESQQAANARFGVRLKEFQDAQTEAKAIASLLRDAHAQFVGLRKKLQTARDEAVAAGMKVSDQGVVSYDTERLTPGERQELAHDPDSQESVRKSVASWQAHIDQCVRNVDDADHGVEVAFAAVVGRTGSSDGTVPDFNGKAQGDIEKYEAQEADDIARRVAKGEKVSAADLAELQRALRDNKGDKGFSQTFLNGLGPDGTLKLTNRLEDLARFDDTKNKNTYLEINGGLADSLAVAMRVPDLTDPQGGHPRFGTDAYDEAFRAWTKTDDARFYNKWRAALREHGTDGYALEAAGDKIAVGYGHGQEIRGYQSLVTLMQQGHGYSPQFVADVTDDMIAAEKKNPDVWDLYGDFSDKGGDGWFANDPVDGALGVMSRDPEGATGYLDPGTAAGKERLDYLLGHGDDGRDWNLVHTTREGAKTDYVGPDVEDSDARKGFGAALEAATTGQAPGEYHPADRHTEPQARILQHTIDTLNSAKQAEKLPQNLTLPLAHILTAYTPDTHEINAQSDSRFEVSPGNTGSVWSDKNGAHVTVARDSLTKLMRGIADDPTAFGHVYGAEQRHAHDLLAALPGDADKTVISNRITDCSRAMGAYDGVRADIVFDERFNKTQWAADFNHGLSNSLSTALMFKPKGIEFLGPAGDAATRALDVYTYESNKEHVAEANLKATEDNVKLYAAGQHDVEDMVRMWGQSRGHDVNSEWTKQYVHVGQQDYNYGRDRALDVLRADR
ncbi:hypothetical protein ACQSME_00870 [Streptomyces sp. 2-6]|uniref:hypothetical protein n=1 Tax=Streptomyces sp. 2-6 TaxID=2978333 RepID=UPI003D12BD88